MRFIGEHTEKVGLEKRTVSYGDANDVVETWTSYKSLYAEFWERQAKEGEQDGQILVIQDVRCKIRFISELNEVDYRINRNGEIYDIQSIVRVGRNKEQLLILERRDND